VLFLLRHDPAGSEIALRPGPAPASVPVTTPAAARSMSAMALERPGTRSASRSASLPFVLLCSGLMGLCGAVVVQPVAALTALDLLTALFVSLDGSLTGPSPDREVCSPLVGCLCD
jgi:hypothetical protein